MPIEILCHIKQINFPFQLITAIFQHSFHPLLDSISISLFFSIFSSFLLIGPLTVHSHPMCAYHGDIFLLFSQHEIIYSNVCGCFRLGIPVYIADPVTWSKKHF